MQKPTWTFRHLLVIGLLTATVVSCKSVAVLPTKAPIENVNVKNWPSKSTPSTQTLKTSVRALG